MPFPEISREIDMKLTKLVDETLKGDRLAVEAIDKEIDALFE